MTRPVVAVDLATRFSAGVALNWNGDVVTQWDSFGKSHSGVAQAIAGQYSLLRGHSDVRPLVVIEDLPPHVPGSDVKRAVYQLQGRILQEFETMGGQWVGNHVLDDVYFVPPMCWQRDMGVWRADLDVFAQAAAAYGYVAPDLAEQRYGGSPKAATATAIREMTKQRTDYVAAYLIAQWARMCMAEQRVWDTSVIRQYRP